jgi:UDP-N-acetylglucosamine--N-acetylmuramyl-(pentapeptide) pyrophosphoryl-undecaprenol N-acetylglucosamine transferase
MSRRLVFATGGTGGHIYPALAVAREVIRRGYEVHLMGQAGGMEERLAAEADLPFVGVPSGKLDRQRPDPRQLLRSCAGVVVATRALRRLRPSLVMGFGGFASFPGCMAAVLTRTPLALHEQNAYPGLVTRLLAPFARKLVLSQPGSASRIRARDVEIIPYPVRERRVDRSEARRLLGLPEGSTLTLVMGGSQGSIALNEGVVNALEELRDMRPLVLHSTGGAHLESVRAATAGLSNYLPRPYVDATLAWSAADLAITRAGTGTLSEAAYFGVPLVMVPLPTASENHQLHNARAFAQSGAGRVLEQDRLAELSAVWRELLDEDTRLVSAAAAARLTPAGATARFADLIEELSAEKTRGGRSGTNDDASSDGEGSDGVTGDGVKQEIR